MFIGARDEEAVRAFGQEDIMAAIRVGRNELCSCGSGRKFKRCCSLNRDITRPSDAAFEMPQLVPGEGADEKTTLRTHVQSPGQCEPPIKRIPVHYNYPEPFGEAVCIYSFPVE
jgi:hypothetical protein